MEQGVGGLVRPCEVAGEKLMKSGGELVDDRNVSTGTIEASILREGKQEKKKRDSGIEVDAGIKEIVEERPFF